MNVLILGSGGREHTLAWKIAQSPVLSHLYIAPGNAGTSQTGTNVKLDILDFAQIKVFLLESNIDMVVVGPEAPLVAGFADFLEQDQELKHIHVIGPKKLGATLEGSKEFAKEFMKRHNVPTAAYQAFSAETLENGYTFLETLSPPYVLKADGLAAGKGVLIIDDLQEAKNELRKMLLEEKFGKASSKVVIEEFLDGIELSCFVLTNGRQYKVLPFAKDYKRIGERDTGLNTGGMGAVSPVPFVDEVFLDKVHKRIIEPTISGLKADGIDYVGFVFIGLINVKGNPKVIEYNVRMGDPETEVVIPRIKSDFLELLLATSKGELDNVELEIDSSFAMTVMAVSGGYPEDYKKGMFIEGLNAVSDEVLVFHAGTSQHNNKPITNGGRVLTVTALDQTLDGAKEKAYKNLAFIHFEGKYNRSDIGFDL